jgi:hypothetical protein
MDDVQENFKDVQPIVISVSRCGGPAENASPLVWWIGRMAMKARYEDVCNPQVGDIVVETSHLMGMCRHRLGLMSALGELLKIEKIEGEGEVYTIQTVEGIEQRWENAIVYVVERAKKKVGE